MAGTNAKVDVPILKDLTIDNITDNVHLINAQTSDARLKYVLERLVSHMHDFARETRLSTTEWMAGIEFLTAVGKKCTDVRQVRHEQHKPRAAGRITDLGNARRNSYSSPTRLVFPSSSTQSTTRSPQPQPKELYSGPTTRTTRKTSRLGRLSLLILKANRCCVFVLSSLRMGSP